MAEEQVIKMEKKIISYLWKTLKVLIFLSFIYTAIIMIRLKNTNTAMMILFAISLFLILNKIDVMDKRIKLLEGK